jgi:hypothetical protein
MKMAVYLYVVGGLWIGSTHADFQRREGNYSLGAAVFLALSWPALAPMVMINTLWHASSPAQCRAGGGRP